MANKDYTCTIEAAVPAKLAYDKIARVQEWWAKDFEGSARKLGDTFTVRFGETFVDFKIPDAHPDSRIVWHVVNCHLHFLKDKTEWNGTSVAWDLAAGGSTTTVTMTHHGLKPDVECYTNCESGWNKHVKQSLLPFLTEGKGTPS